MNLTALYLYARSFVADRKGVTALEYGLIAALIAVVIIGAVTTLGGNAATQFQYIADKIGAAKPQ